METIDLTLAADPEGTCPACRGRKLVVTKMPKHRNCGTQVDMVPAAHCQTCNYVHFLSAGQMVRGAKQVD